MIKATVAVLALASYAHGFQPLPLRTRAVAAPANTHSPVHSAAAPAKPLTSLRSAVAEETFEQRSSAVPTLQVDTGASRRDAAT